GVYNLHAGDETTPFFLVRTMPEASVSALLEIEITSEPLSGTLHFTSRKTDWKYTINFSGDTDTGKQYEIISGNGVSFSKSGSSGFVSDQPLAFSQVYAYRFQLAELNGGGEPAKKVIIPDLPFP